MAYSEMDWLHRTLQFLLGAVVGAGAGFWIWREQPDWPGWAVLGGGALVFGILGAVFGDKLWHAVFGGRF